MRVASRAAAAGGVGSRMQACLLLDAGNSRVKWAIVAGKSMRPDRGGIREPFIARGVVAVQMLRRSSTALAAAVRASGPNARVYVCNVGGAQLAGRIRAAVRAAGLSAPRFARSAASAAGVINGYAEAWRLGVDRWLALIGAHHRYPHRDLCIVGIGSAMTIDLLTADGCHHGGSITPGPNMMVDALLRNTAGISRRAGGGSVARLVRMESQRVRRRTELFARDTRSALVVGCQQACACLIEYAVELARKRLSRQPHLVLTGGAAELVAPLLATRHRLDPELVLRGLMRLAAEPGRSGPTSRSAR